jgi:hypothetical protein
MSLKYISGRGVVSNYASIQAPERPHDMCQHALSDARCIGAQEHLARQQGMQRMTALPVTEDQIPGMSVCGRVQVGLSDEQTLRKSKHVILFIGRHAYIGRS